MANNLFYPHIFLLNIHLFYLFLLLYDIYDRELTAIGKKINLDLNNRLDFGIDSDIIVGRIIKFKPAYLYYYEHVDYYDP